MVKLTAQEAVVGQEQQQPDIYASEQNLFG